MNPLAHRIASHIAASARVKHSLVGSHPYIGTAITASVETPHHEAVNKAAEAAHLIADAFRNGRKLMLCGNGGSAADSQHVAAEFTNILTKDFDRPGLPAISLTTDTSFLTSFMNDSKQFTEIFSRQVNALGNTGDVLIGISTSGESLNVIRALEAAKEKGIATIALMGESGSLSRAADIAICVPSKVTAHIQESHLALEHAICDAVEVLLYPDKKTPPLQESEAI